MEGETRKRKEKKREERKRAQERKGDLSPRSGERNLPPISIPDLGDKSAHGEPKRDTRLQFEFPRSLRRVGLDSDVGLTALN